MCGAIMCVEADNDEDGNDDFIVILYGREEKKEIATKIGRQQQHTFKYEF